ncbi:MAG: hypothetical protein HY909_04720 [Deltaproteobacteria bacterium]|nr:hypothetical protein [Deltaproteobacteria bacterium]
MAPWVAPGAGVRLQARLTHAAGVTLDLEALAPLVRPRLAVEDLGTLHQPSAVVLRGSLGVLWRFP